MLYKPALKLLQKSPLDSPLMNSDNSSTLSKEQEKLQKKKAEDKRKSNLELFKEELKRYQNQK